MPNPYKQGDRVRYKDGDPRVFTVYHVYSDYEVSLGLADDPGIEQDYQTDIDEIQPA